MIFRIFPR